MTSHIVFHHDNTHIIIFHVKMLDRKKIIYHVFSSMNNFLYQSRSDTQQSNLI